MPFQKKKSADVGIAIGTGTDVAVVAADIILVRSNLLDVLAIIGLARATFRKMGQNLAWATGFITFSPFRWRQAFYINPESCSARPSKHSSCRSAPS